MTKAKKTKTKSRSRKMPVPAVIKTLDRFTDVKLEKTYRDAIVRLLATRGVAEEQLDALFKRVKDSRAGEAALELEERAAQELDTVLERLGLYRQGRVDELIDLAEKRGVRRERRRAKKEATKLAKAA